LRELDPDVNLEPKLLVLEVKEELPPVDVAPAPKPEVLDANLDPEEDPPVKEPVDPELTITGSGILPWKQPAHNGPSPVL